jgi:hypothetical protein
VENNEQLKNVILVSSFIEVQAFLKDFHAKYRQHDIVFMEEKMNNTNVLLSLDIAALEKREIIESVLPIDYSAGPLNDQHFGNASIWVFGKFSKQQELLIKLSAGRLNSSVVCLAFLAADKTLLYPYKN